MLSPQKILHLAKEFSESSLSVCSSPHFAHIHAVIRQGADGVGLLGHHVAVDWVEIPVFGPRVGGDSSRVEGNFIYPDEAAPALIEVFEDVNEPNSIPFKISFFHRVFVQERLPSVSVMKVEFEDIGNRLSTHFWGVWDVFVDILHDHMSREHVSSESQDGFLDRRYFFAFCLSSE